jgi:hypothetical protein
VAAPSTGSERGHRTFGEATPRYNGKTLPPTDRNEPFNIAHLPTRPVDNSNAAGTPVLGSPPGESVLRRQDGPRRSLAPTGPSLTSCGVTEFVSPHATDGAIYAERLLMISGAQVRAARAMLGGQRVPSRRRQSSQFSRSNGLKARENNKSGP